MCSGAVGRGGWSRGQLSPQPAELHQDKAQPAPAWGCGASPGRARLGPHGSCFGLAGTQRRLTALWGTALQLVPRQEWAQGSPGSRLPQAAPYEAKSSREAASPRAVRVPRHPTHCVGAELLSPAASCIRDQTHRSFTDPGQGAVHLAVMAGAGRAVRCSAVLPREGNERANGGFWLRHLVLQTQAQV